MAVAQAPKDVVARSDGEAMLRIQINRIGGIMDPELLQAKMVEIGLGGKAGGIGNLMCPSAQNIPSRVVVNNLPILKVKIGRASCRERV